jgi:hypothetical protein
MDVGFFYILLEAGVYIFRYVRIRTAQDVMLGRKNYYRKRSRLATKARERTPPLRTILCRLHSCRPSSTCRRTTQTQRQRRLPESRHLLQVSHRREDLFGQQNTIKRGRLSSLRQTLLTSHEICGDPAGHD